MSGLVRALPTMSMQQLRLLLEFYEGDSELGRQYAGLRADIRAELKARGAGATIGDGLQRSATLGDDRRSR